MEKPLDLGRLGTTIYDRANPVQGAYGLWAERGIAHLSTDLPAEDVRVIGNLFVAAPVLLEACEALYQLHADGIFRLPDQHYRAITMAAAAIAKARGGKP